ncbi:hypothetical protein JaAD80_00700 [Janthinobacterium sp. AD80]|nr:hypothetical protein JaAD80_00700 [Janthinobacterium sp. AD80]
MFLVTKMTKQFNAHAWIKRKLTVHMTTPDQYREFCRLRDYRKPGVEVPHHTEAEAFALAVQSKTGHTEPAQRKKNPTTKGIK